MNRRGPGQRAGLSQAAVLNAARELLAEDGAGALSMRALARRLDVAPNAIYSYVQDKDALLDALLDDLLAQVDAPDPQTFDPIAGLYHLMTSTYRVLVTHPELLPAFLARQGARGSNAVQLGEVMNVLLARAGVSDANVAEARRALIVHAIGSAAFATGAPGENRLIPAAESDGDFARSLQWLLRGITARTTS